LKEDIIKTVPLKDLKGCPFCGKPISVEYKTDGGFSFKESCPHFVGARRNSGGNITLIFDKGASKNV
jgi:hypothetical protein